MNYAYLTSIFVSLFSVAAPSNIEKKLEPSKAHEECMTLTPPQELIYSFKASSDLKFNLHYHVGKEVFYPIKHDKISENKGSFKPAIKQDYCLMWSNNSKSASTVAYEFEIK